MDCNDLDPSQQQWWDRLQRLKQFLPDNKYMDIMAINDVLQCDDVNDVVDGVDVQLNGVQRDELIHQYQPVLSKILINNIFLNSRQLGCVHFESRPTRTTRHKFYYYNLNVKHEHFVPLGQLM